MYEENEIARHKKKSSKSVAKSKHKHNYKECLFTSPNERVYLASYCTICGKIGEVILFPSESITNRRFRILTDIEILEKYKHLEIKKVDNIFKNKYVKLGDK